MFPTTNKIRPFVVAGDWNDSFTHPCNSRITQSRREPQVVGVDHIAVRYLKENKVKSFVSMLTNMTKIVQNLQLI